MGKPIGYLHNQEHIIMEQRLHFLFHEITTSRKNAFCIFAHCQLLNHAVVCYASYLELTCLSFCFVFPESPYCFSFFLIGNRNTTLFLMLFNI